MLNRFPLSLCLAIAWFGGGASLFATEYFVTRQGDDSNLGTSRAQAFASIQKGVDALEPGDTLTIGPGEYFEHVRREGIGAEAQTVIRAEIPGTVLLRGDRPAPHFKQVEGEPYVYVTDFEADQAPAVLELDTLTILEPMPNATEPAYLPGKFYCDKEAGKLYISSSDWRPASEHRYSVSVTPTHGIYLSDATRVVIDGLAVTGFKAAAQQPRNDNSLYSTWGIMIVGAKNCVIRNCRAFLNGQGIAINSLARPGYSDDPYDYGENVIENCDAWGNASDFGQGDRGGITLIQTRRDVVRHCRAFLNGHYGINIRSSNKNFTEEDKSRLIDNITWGNGYSDVKVKTGYDNVHVTERTFAPYPSNDYDPSHCLLGEANPDEIPGNNIVLSAHDDLDLNAEFADPANHDYRLQATSRFRGAAPDGADKGPNPYKPNVYFVSTDGDDEADGLSMQNAWRTVAHAMEALKAGDTLFLAPGGHRVNGAFNLSGERDAPISIRGRGSEPVVLRGSMKIEDSSHTTFQRLHFLDDVAVSASEAVVFRNCRFNGAGIGLNVARTAALDVRHCEFTAFEDAAIALNSSDAVHLAGNLYDNQNGPAVRADGATALRYSNYNSYRASSPAWQVNGRPQSLEAVQAEHEPESSALSDAWSADEAESPANQSLRAARGPLGRPVGTYRHEATQNELRLVHAPQVHSVSATTANLEWRTSLPAICEIAWGPTPECENSESFAVDRFGSFSLTGLEPGRKYYFLVKSLRLPREIDEKIDAAVRQPGAELVSFTTRQQRPQPRVYYVATDGSNTNDGTSRADAWRTIHHTAAQAGPGDTVCIAGGTYPERVRIRATGTAEAPITFRSIPGEKVILSGNDKKLGQIFLATGKKHLRFDGFYFRETSREPLQGWRLQLCGEFNLYRCEDIHITRCFSETRGGYSARFVSAWDAKDLLIRNCVVMNKMSGSLMLWPAPGFRMEHSVVARSLTGNMVFSNGVGEKVTITNSIFTDMLQKKARVNVPLFYGSLREGSRMENNCYYLREHPPEERELFRDQTIDDVSDVIIHPLFANPQFTGDDSSPDEHGIDAMMHPDREIDFDDFFATNPEVNERDIGLQRERFKEFQFMRSSEE